MEFIKRNKAFLILGLIMVVGVFLRTYQFHDWLLFENDQARDAVIISQIASDGTSWPLLGPSMRSSGDTQDVLFRIGPIYYYFQIISANIFGSEPDKMAYLDLLLGIFSIPLLYYLLKRYFSENISLLSAGLYTVSFFAIKYSRFAWNPNSIPFFAMLFVLSLHEFVSKKEKTSWKWVVTAGISLGIGVQLHATILLLFPLVLMITAGYLLKKNMQIWRKIVAVIILAFFINIPQVISEWQTGFANSRALFNSPVKEGRADKKSKISIIADNASCHMEANAFLLSSLGQESCNYDFVKAFENNKAGRAFRAESPWLEMLAILFFSISGYSLLIYRFKNEKEKEKRYFLGLIIVFVSAFFAIMLPVIGSNFKEFRYFNPVLFVPFILFGLIIDFLIKKRTRIFLLLALIAIVFVIGANLASLGSTAGILAKHEGNDGHAVFLGETEDIFGYIKNKTVLENFDKAYLMSEDSYSGNIFFPGSYIAKQYGYELIKTPSPENVPKGMPLFLIASNEGSMPGSKDGRAVKNADNFGLMRIYELEN